MMHGSSKLDDNTFYTTKKRMNKTIKATVAALCMATLAFTSCNNGEVVVADSEKKLDHLIFEEICYSGTYKQEWKQLLTEDQYIKITNPTDKPLYLDGMALAQSGLGNRMAANLNAGTDYRDTHFGASILVRFPGKPGGKEYPIKPGGSIFIAKVAYDHIGGEHETSHANSYDLSGVDFEWASKKQLANEDEFAENPNVPNLTPVYPIEDENESDELPKPLIPEAGVLALIQIPDTVTTADLLNKDTYLWHTGWTTNEKLPDGGVGNHGGGHVHDGGFNNVVFLKIPNAWVVDAVQISPQKEFVWNVVPNLDKSSAGVFVYTTDKRRNPKEFSGLALVRKHDGKKFVDTDDSGQDFEVRQASGAKRTAAMP